MKSFLLTALLCMAVSVPSFSISADDIIRKYDETQTFRTFESYGSIITTDRFGTKKSDFTSWSQGNSLFLVEFTSIEEKGQRILRTPEKLFLYYPDSEEIIRLQGAALRQSLLGSDISYEDMTEGGDTLSSYTASLEGEEDVSGRICHIIRLEAKTKNIAYPIKKIWIDRENYVPWKSEYYSKSDRLLKTMKTATYDSSNGKIIITSLTVFDALRKNSQTDLVIHNYRINPALHPGKFSLEELSW